MVDLSYWSIVMIGISVLFPFNAFLKAEEFFRYQFQDTSFRNSFQMYIMLNFTFTQTIFSSFLIFSRLDSKVNTIKQSFLYLKEF